MPSQTQLSEIQGVLSGVGIPLNSAGQVTPRGLVVALPVAGRPGAATLAALPRLAAGLWAQGYRFTTIASAGNDRTWIMIVTSIRTSITGKTLARAALALAASSGLPAISIR